MPRVTSAISEDELSLTQLGEAILAKAPTISADITRSIRWWGGTR